MESTRIKYFNRGKGGAGWIGKGIYLFHTIFRMYFNVRKFKPDIFLSFSSPYASTTGWLYRKPVITFEDTELSTLLHKFTKRFSTLIITGTSFRFDFGPKQIRIPFYKELAYLHPEVFTPDVSILKKYGLESEEAFIIVRLVGKKTIHEKGRKGLDETYILKCIRQFSPLSRIFISCEHALNNSFRIYELRQNVIKPFTFQPSDVHHLLYFSSLLFGESSTMAAEAAVLGTPAIYIDKMSRGYCKELEQKYGLMYSFSEDETGKQNAILKAIEIIGNPEIKKECRVNREKMLHDKLDMTGWMVELIERFERTGNLEI